MKIYESDQKAKKILAKYADGATDSNCSNVRVIASMVAIYLTLQPQGLQYLVAGRCAPGQSWSNIAERTMSLLNLALQNLTTCRKICATPEIETKIKRAQSLSGIRLAAEEDGRVKEEWGDAVEATRIDISSRLENIS